MDQLVYSSKHDFVSVFLVLNWKYMNIMYFWTIWSEWEHIMRTLNLKWEVICSDTAKKESRWFVLIHKICCEYCSFTSVHIALLPENGLLPALYNCILFDWLFTF